MATFQVTPPERFSFKPEEWSKWIRRFERFRLASELNKKDEESQVNTLIYSMGDEADDILQSFVMSADDKKKYNAVKSKFEEHFIIKRNVIFERARFNMRVQTEGESVDNFITDLYALAEFCNFGVLRNELIRDRIVVGIRDKALSERLQLEADLTLTKAVNLVRQKEVVRKQQHLMTNSLFTSPEIDVLKDVKHARQRSNQQKAMRGEKQSRATYREQIYTKPDAKKCDRCFGPLHKRIHCPARNSQCHSCGKTGHWKKACRSKRVREISGEIFPIYSADNDSNLFLGEVHINVMKSGSPRDLPWQAEVCLNQNKLQFKLDSGADVSVIPLSLYERLAEKQSLKLEPTNKILLGPCNYKIKCSGKFLGNLSTDSRSLQEEIYVVKGLQTPLLGRMASSQLKLIQKVEKLTAIPQENDEQYTENITKSYPSLFKGLGELEGEYRIRLIDEPTPFALTVPRKVPVPLLKKTKAEIDRMLEMGVISPVHEPTQWCAPMVVVPKPSGDVRICVDLTKLNGNILREVHPLPSVDYTLAKFGGSKIFSKMDANSAFWQRKLSNESRLLTTFLTPWGRFCFNRLPYGISTGSEQFQRCLSAKLEGLEGVEVLIDDIIVHGADQKQHDKRLTAVLNKLANANITLNRKKCEFNVKTVKVLGHIVSPNGITADPTKVNAIISMQRPKNVKELRSFLGMVNHLSKFQSHLANETKPLRDLLCKENQWFWGPKQDKSFLNVKHSLVSTPILALYDPNKETKINSDASSYGIGGVVLQKQDDGNWKPVSYVSRALTPTETRYSQIEKECLAFTWTCERSSDYILGKEIIGETDHKPLIPLLTTYMLEKLPPRIQRYRMRLMRFQIKKMIHVPGKHMYTSDTLSRMSAIAQSAESLIDHDEMTQYVASIIETLPVSDVRLQQIIQAQGSDPVCFKLKEFILEGWPEKYKISDSLKPYWNFRGELNLVQNVILKSVQILIPSAMRLDVLDKIHQGHQGIVKCRSRARQSVWWPGISREIQDMVQSCRICAGYKTNTPEPLNPTGFPERPWQLVGIDFFHTKASDYLLIVDYYSRYIEVAGMNKGKRAPDVINTLKDVFARHGIPEEIRSDNGPPFDSSEFMHFAKEWDIHLSPSSPYYPQSNGEAERSVQTIKKILKKEKDKYQALLAYRSTPLQNGFSPAELLMGRKLRTTVPVFHTQLQPKWPDLDKLNETERSYRHKQQAYYNARHHAKPLPQLYPGQEVKIKTHAQPGIVVEKSQSPRQYVIATPTTEVKRNRVQITPLPPSTPSVKTATTQSQSSPVSVSERPVTPPLNILSRPKRIIKPSLKARENMNK